MRLSEDAKDAMYNKGIPNYMHDAIINYYENGLPPGDFLSALINNDLKETYGRADDINVQCIKNYIMWFYNDAPAGTWGYEGAVKDYVTEFHKENKDET